MKLILRVQEVNFKMSINIFSQKSDKKEVSEFSDNSLTLYCHFIYKYLGRSLLQKKNFKSFFKKSIYNKKYEQILKQANLKLMPDEYFISVFITIISTMVLSLFLSMVFLGINILFSMIFLFGGVILVSVLGIFLYDYPIVLAKTRSEEIDAALPYLMPYLKILSKEIGLSKIIGIIDDFLIYKEVKIEFQRIKYYSTFLGYDIHSSIREAMQSCPSRKLADMMNDLVTISNSGGNIYSYLDRKLANLNAEIEAEEAKNIETLLIFSQIYVVLLLIAPLFYTVMSAILNLINFSADSASIGAGSSFLGILALLFFLPFGYTGFMMLIYYTKPLYARLKPMKHG